MADKQYGVLHEIGDYSAPRPLNDDDNRAVNEQMSQQDDDKKDNRK